MRPARLGDHARLTGTRGREGRGDTPLRAACCTAFSTDSSPHHARATKSLSQFCPRASHPVPHRLALQRRGAPAVSVRYAMRYMRVRGLDLAGLPHVFAPSMHGGPSRGTACIQRRAANAGRLTVFMRSCRRANPEPHYSLAHSPAPCRSSSAGRRRRRRGPGSTRGRPTVAIKRSTVRESSS